MDDDKRLSNYIPIILEPVIDWGLKFTLRLNIKYSRSGF